MMSVPAGAAAVNQQEGKAAFTAEFCPLGRQVWFTLEACHRDDPERQERLVNMPKQVGKQVDRLANMRIAWISTGKWSERNEWSDREWEAFLRTWEAYAGKVFIDAASNPTNQEKQLFKFFSIYWTFYAALPDTPDLPEGAPEDVSMEWAKDKIELHLAEMHQTLGYDPCAPCHACSKCALERKLMRCSRCKQVYYCSKECQKKDWKGHKKSCHAA